MAKYSMSEQKAEKVLSKLLQNTDTVKLVETIMGVNKEMANNDLQTSKDILDIKKQLAEVKSEIANS